MKKSMRKILVACLTLAMLMVNSLNVFAAVSGDFNIKFIFHDTDNNDQVIKEEYLTVNGTEGVAQDVDFSSIMPEGYEVDSRFTESTTVSVTPYLDGTSREVYVKKVQQTVQTVTTLYVTYKLADGNVVDTQTVTTGATGAEGEAWTFMLGCDGYELPEGYKLAEGEEKYTTVSVPFGAASGVTLTVEPINGTVDPVKPAKETVLNIVDEIYISNSCGYFILCLQRLLRGLSLPYFLFSENGKSTFKSGHPARIIFKARKELNMQKDYETFVEKLEIGIYEATGIPRENISFEKEGGRFAPVGDRLLVKFAEHDDAWEVCGLYTQELFKSYQNGSPFEEIIKEIIDDLNRIKKADIYEKTRVIRDYEKTKPLLFIRLLNADKYSADLQDAVYKTLGDIALVLYMKVTEYEGCVTSTKIRQGMLEQWGKECDEVFQEAILNTYFMSPPRIYRWEQMIFNPEYEGESFMNLGDKCELKKDAMGNCLSTTKKTNGAVAVFLPGVAEQLAYMLDSDFYMVFTSVHEVMIHNDKFVEPEDLQCVLRDTIREATPKEDYLTSRIYQYNRETHKFICVTPLEKDEK